MTFLFNINTFFNVLKSEFITYKTHLSLNILAKTVKFSFGLKNSGFQI